MPEPSLSLRIRHAGLDRLEPDFQARRTLRVSSSTAHKARMPENFHLSAASLAKWPATIHSLRSKRQTVKPFCSLPLKYAGVETLKLDFFINDTKSIKRRREIIFRHWKSHS